MQDLRQAFGAVPDLAATMANSPPLVSSFVAVVGQFSAGTFAGGEREVLTLSNAVANSCPWAVAFHSTLALREGIAAEDVEATRRELPGPARLAALSCSPGGSSSAAPLDRADAQAFLDAGFDRAQILEVITGVAASTLANYAGNVTHPPLEPAFQAQAWAAG